MSGGLREVDFELLRAAAAGEVAAIEAALAAGADVASRVEHGAEGEPRRLPDEGGWTPLHFAAAGDAADAVRALLAAGSDVEARARGGWTPLHAALAHAVAPAEPQVVPLLLAAGAAPDSATLGGATPLTIAAERRLVTTLRRLHAAGAAPQRDAGAERALAAAALDGDLELVASLLAAGTHAGAALEEAITLGLPEGRAALTLLLAAGADPDTTCREDEVPALTLAILLDRSGEAVLELLAAGATPGADSLAAAATQGSPEVLSLLLDAGVDPNAPTTYRSTALVEAARGGFIEEVRLLLAAGAATGARDPMSRTALEVASMRGHQEVAELLAAASPKDLPTSEHVLLAVRGGDVRALRAILLDGSAVDETTAADGTPVLTVAAVAGQLECLDLLLARGAAPGRRDRDGRTALMAAAAAGQTGAIDHLLAADERTEAEDLGGATAVWWAAKEGKAEALRRLLAAGAEPARPGPRGWTPLEAAVRAGSTEAAEALLGAGARVGGEGGAILALATSKGLTGAVRRLLADGADPDAGQLAGRSALSWAISEGHDDIVELLLAAGADDGCTDATGFSPLALASWLRKEEIVGRLEAAGASMTPADELMVAVGRRDVPRARRLLAAEPALARTPGVLVRAVGTGSAALVDALLAAGADPNERDDEGTPALQLAILQGAAIISSLAAAAADLEARSPHGSTALHRAAGGNHRKELAALLAAGAEVDARDASGATPLMRAARQGWLQAVETLVAAGASPDAEDRSGMTALSHARKKPRVANWLEARGARASAQAASVADLFLPAMQGRDEEIERLVASLPDLETAHPLFGLPMDLAAATGNTTLTRLLLERGVPLDAPNGETGPLHAAAARGHIEVARLLLAAGADVGRCDDAGRSPLHRAAMMGHETVVRLLLDAGSDLAATDAEGLTAETLAHRNQQERILRRTRPGVPPR